MKIVVGNYRIVSDAYNVSIEEKATAKKDTATLKAGEDYWKPSNSYHPNLEQACISLLNRQLKASEAESIGDLAFEVREAARQICEAVKGAKA